MWGTLTWKVVSGCPTCSVYEIHYVFGHVVLDYAIYWQSKIEASWSQVTADHNPSLSWGKLSEGVGSLFSSKLGIEDTGILWEIFKDKFLKHEDISFLLTENNDSLIFSISQKFADKIFLLLFKFLFFISLQFNIKQI